MGTAGGAGVQVCRVTQRGSPDGRVPRHDDRQVPRPTGEAPMSVQMIPRNQNRAADAGKGLIGLVGVVALVVGVPAALVAWVGSPLPSAMPSLSAITDALRDTYIPDEFLVKLLALVCWLVWIELVASLLVEGVAYARGRKAASVPLAGGLQRGAARLITTVALLGVLVATKGPSTSDRAPQPLAAVAQQPVMSLVVDDGGVGDVERAGPDAAAADPVVAAAPTYEVQRRDTLWDIAERHLGDPFRWQEIFRLNEGCPQADGRCLTDPDLIHAGWRLELPGDAVGITPATPAPTPAEAPLPAPATPDPSPSPADQSSVVLDGGMVLINDGAGGSTNAGAGGDVLVASGSVSTSAAGAAMGGAGQGGMVLLPDDAFSRPDRAEGSAVLAGPPAGGPGDGYDASRDSGGDELASAP